jgi:hypothetical protein
VKKSTPALAVVLHLLFQLLFRDISKPNIKKTHNVTSLERKLNYFRAEAVDKDGPRNVVTSVEQHFSVNYVTRI